MPLQGVTSSGGVPKNSYPSPADMAQAQATGLVLWDPDHPTPMKVGEQYYMREFPGPTAPWTLQTVGPKDRYLTDPVGYAADHAKVLALVHRLPNVPALHGVDFGDDGDKLTAAITWKAKGGKEPTFNAQLSTLIRKYTQQVNIVAEISDQRQASWQEDHGG
jgi:hypothetical protein